MDEKLTRDQILTALTRPDELLAEKEITDELCIFERAARVLAFGSRKSTRDADGVFVPKSEVYEAARRVAVSMFCHKHGFTAPKWVHDSNRIFRPPYFAAKSKNLCAILLQESPAALWIRNLFVSANALSRA